MRSRREELSLVAWAEMAYSPDPFEITGLLSYIHVGDRVLDLGCSSGNITLQMASHGAQVTGIDVSEHRLQRARGDAVAQGLSSRTRFVCGDFSDAAFVKTLGRFELVTAIRSLTCIVEPQSFVATLSAIWHVLMPKGLVFVSDFRYVPTNSVYAGRYAEGEKRGFPKGSFESVAADGSTFIAHHYRSEEIEEICRSFKHISLRFHEGRSLNGNRCEMFEFVGKKTVDSESL